MLTVALKQLNLKQDVFLLYFFLLIKLAHQSLFWLDEWWVSQLITCAAQLNWWVNVLINLKLISSSISKLIRTRNHVRKFIHHFLSKEYLIVRYNLNSQRKPGIVTFLVFGTDFITKEVSILESTTLTIKGHHG